MWEHIWIAYGEVLFTFVIVRALSLTPWARARLSGPTRLIVGNAVAAAGMIAFAAAWPSLPASPGAAYALAIGGWAAFTAFQVLRLITRPAPAPQSDALAAVEAVAG
jgi:hypothetical protein